jgi:hypothetical protein
VPFGHCRALQQRRSLRAISSTSGRVLKRYRRTPIRR